MCLEINIQNQKMLFNFFLTKYDGCLNKWRNLLFIGFYTFINFNRCFALNINVRLTLFQTYAFALNINANLSLILMHAFTLKVNACFALNIRSQLRYRFCNIQTRLTSPQWCHLLALFSHGGTRRVHGVGDVCYRICKIDFS